MEFRVVSQSGKTVPERHEGENAGKTREGAMNSGHIV